MLTIETLRIIWWGLLGFILIGFTITDGYDLGAAILFPWIARNEVERTVVLNTIRPFWEGNQVWIILGAGSLFAAFPAIYAVAFSGAYFVILLLLLTMGISRPVSFKYRSKLPSHFWRRFWDWIVFIGGLAPAIILGMLVGNVMIGLPFQFDNDLRVSYTGSFIQLFNPFALWCGLTSVAMITMHGGIYLAIKTENPIYDRAIFWTRVAAVFVILLFAVGGLWVAFAITGYQVIGGVNTMADSNPLHKEVTATVGAWLQNYYLHPITMIVPALGFFGAALTYLTARIGNGHLAFVFSSISIIGIISTVGVSMFPFMLPSSANLVSSLLVWDASSSRLTLLVMLFAVLFFMPIIILYTSWVHYALRGKVKISTIQKEKKHTIY